jgi:hypothetical protein
MEHLPRPSHSDDDVFHLQPALEMVGELVLAGGDKAKCDRILKALVSSCQPHPLLTKELVFLLATFELPAMLIPYLPRLVGDEVEEVEMVVNHLKDMMEADRDLLVLIIGTMSELSLSTAMKREVCDITIAALKVVDESDMPTIIRTMLKSLTTKTGGKVMASIRRESTTLSDSGELLVMEVISDALQSNMDTVFLYFDSVFDDKSSDGLVLLDLMVIQILIGSPRNSAVASNVTIEMVRRSWLTCGLMEALVDKAALPRWGAFLNSFLKFGHLLLLLGDGLCANSNVYVHHQDKNVRKAYASTTVFVPPKVQGLHVFGLCKILFVGLFLRVPASRRQVLDTLSAMCKECGRQGDARQHGGCVYGSGKVPPVGMLNTSRNYKLRSYIHCGEVAADCLVEIAQQDPQLLSQFADVLSNVFWDNAFLKTTRTICHRVSRATALMAASSKENVHTLLITVQKQLFNVLSIVGQKDDHLAVEAVASSDIAATQNRIAKKNVEYDKLLGQSRIALTVACHLMNASALSQQEAFNIVDWVLRIIPSAPKLYLTAAVEFLHFVCLVRQSIAPASDFGGNGNAVEQVAGKEPAAVLTSPASVAVSVAPSMSTHYPFILEAPWRMRTRCKSVMPQLFKCGILVKLYVPSENVAASGGGGEIDVDMSKGKDEDSGQDNSLSATVALPSDLHNYELCRVDQPCKQALVLAYRYQSLRQAFGNDVDPTATGTGGDDDAVFAHHSDTEKMKLDVENWATPLEPKLDDVENIHFSPFDYVSRNYSKDYITNKFKLEQADLTFRDNVGNPLPQHILNISVNRFPLHKPRISQL